ncbi:MAG: DUF1540 domain-containing protein [Oscillospiraceae bacterium]|nr:DUF1540 domain-containing protein [Oscillospiraceae bacterium]MBQ8670814.1 DUF1540 domain-containing protein [Oscillospiraceae bacterium]
MQNEKFNSGICCDVKNCVYHDKGCHCTAEKVNIGPQHANTSADTICSTFRPQA